MPLTEEDFYLEAPLGGGCHTWWLEKYEAPGASRSFGLMYKNHANWWNLGDQGEEGAAGRLGDHDAAYWGYQHIPCDNGHPVYDQWSNHSTSITFGVQVSNTAGRVAPVYQCSRAKFNFMTPDDAPKTSNSTHTTLHESWGPFGTMYSGSAYMPSQLVMDSNMTVNAAGGHSIPAFSNAVCASNNSPYLQKYCMRTRYATIGQPLAVMSLANVTANYLGGNDWRDDKCWDYWDISTIEGTDYIPYQMFEERRLDTYNSIETSGGRWTTLTGGVANNSVPQAGWKYKWSWDQATNAARPNKYFTNYINPMFYRKMDCTSNTPHSEQSPNPRDLYAADTLQNKVFTACFRHGIDVQSWNENAQVMREAMVTGQSGDYEIDFGIYFWRFQFLPIGHVVLSHVGFC